MTDRAIDLAVGQGDDDARPNAADQQQAPATTPEPQQPAGPTETDPDVLEHQAALAALEAEEKAGKDGGDQQQQDGGQQQATQPQQEPAPGTPPAGDQQQQRQRPRAVPLERFNEVNRALQQERERRAYLEGALAARTGTAPAESPGTTPTEQQAPPADPIRAEIQQQRALLREIAGRFDRGEITLAEVEEQRGQAEDRIAELNLQRAQQTQGAPTADVLETLRTEAHLVGLYQHHPYAANLTEQQAAMLAQRAQTDAALEGRPIGSGPAETRRLREAIAKLSDEWGPKWGVQPSRAVTNTPAPGQQQPTTPRSQPNLSPAAQARSAKMAMAAALPPDPAQFGQGAQAEISDAQIATMSDEEIAALPAHVQRRLLQTHL